MDQNILIWLQNWYDKQCDGDWEHTYGIQIGTMDNPGWSVKISLIHSGLVPITSCTLQRSLGYPEDYLHYPFERVKIDNVDDDWITCWVENDEFYGAGDPTKLLEILTRFRNWAEDDKNTAK